MLAPDLDLGNVLLLMTRGKGGLGKLVPYSITFIELFQQLEKKDPSLLSTGKTMTLKMN